MNVKQKMRKKFGKIQKLDILRILKVFELLSADR